LDGKFIYTQVRLKSCEGLRLNVFIYPVPARNALHLAVKSTTAINTQLEIYDMRGRVVQRKAAKFNIGSNNVEINVTGLAAGQYVLRGSNTAITINEKFTIAR
ncbi:MAG: T9SS type A sorting domain-containing protein, partial [Bacteroidota bacterium]